MVNRVRCFVIQVCFGNADNRVRRFNIRDAIPALLKVGLPAPLELREF